MFLVAALNTSVESLQVLVFDNECSRVTTRHPINLFQSRSRFVYWSPMQEPLRSKWLPLAPANLFTEGVLTQASDLRSLRDPSKKFSCLKARTESGNSDLEAHVRVFRHIKNSGGGWGPLRLRVDANLS